MQINGSSILITGGASGLGLATARAVVDRGARVTIVDLDKSAGDAAAATLGPAGRFVEASVLEPDQVATALDEAEALGPLRAVVHCAGQGGDRLRILDREGNAGDFRSFQEVVTVNLFGTYNVLRLSAERMARNDPTQDGRGAIVLTSSIAAFDGQIGQTSYTASKAAVHGMTLVAARDLASRQIRVNTIAPGTFDTPMLARLRDDLREALASAVPHPKRLGDPQDFAHMAVALIENSYINGETVRLDGAIRMPPR
jgi:NAD(P)-dependent dehydrogenase (short-subunit alcohol dehydrogenase family)